MTLRLIIAATIAVLFSTIVLAQTLVPSPTADPTAQSSPSPYPSPAFEANQIYSFVVPRGHILRGQQLSPEMLSVVQMQGDMLSEIHTTVPGEFLTDSSLIIGQYALCDLEPFTPIYSADLTEEMPAGNVLRCGMIPRTIPLSLFSTQGIPMEVGARGSLFLEKALNDNVALMLPVIFDAEIAAINSENVSLLVPDSYRVSSLIFAIVENGIPVTLSPQVPNFKADFLFFEGAN